MVMDVVYASLLLVVAALLLLVVVGFQPLSGRKKSGLTVELARVVTRETQGTWLGDFEEDRVNKLLLETAEPDGQLCAHLDTIELDENLQFLRLSADYCGRPSREVIKYRCQLANESESFYRCRLVSNGGDPSKSQLPCGGVQDQWLYTIIQPQQQKPDIMEIHSNVVPRQAYLKRLKDTISTCGKHDLCTGGFSRFSVLREGEPYHLSCTNCVLGDQLKQGTAHVDAELVELRDLEETDAKLVEGHPDLGKGSEGTVAKIYWRKGVFARKTFFWRGPSFERELDIAREVSHSNIVHCFGASVCSPVDPSDSEVSLYMELLEGSLLQRIQEPIQNACPFSFQDILDILLQVASAMKQLHDKNFIHGDLKPGNILLSRLRMPHSKSGTFYLAKVADFGCVQRVPPEGFANPNSADGKSSAPVLFSSVGGTTHYIAPEVFTHRVDKIPPTHPKMIDVYSFGVVAYQMLARVPILYEDYEDRIKELKTGVKDGTLRPNTGFTGTLDSDRNSLITSLVEKCWVSNPESRLSFSDICDILTSKHEENRAHSLEHGENGAYSIEQGAHGSSPCSADVSKSDNSKEFKDKYV